jgi:hypothetical protein
LVFYGVHGYKDVHSEVQNISPKQKRGGSIVVIAYTPAKYPRLIEAGDELCDESGYDHKHITATKDRGYLITTKL